MKTRVVLLICFGLLSFSCTNYLKLNSETEEKELYRLFKMNTGKDSLSFGAYLDYYYDTINPDMVYLSQKELNKLFKSSVSRKGKQILFLHNDTSFYLNIFGFYYPDLYLTEIKEPKIKYEEIPLTNGKARHFIYNGKPVSDYFLPYKGGILRFTAIGDPRWYPERYNTEIDFVFYVLNQKYFRLKI